MTVATKVRDARRALRAAVLTERRIRADLTRAEEETITAVQKLVDSMGLRVPEQVHRHYRTGYSLYVYETLHADPSAELKEFWDWYRELHPSLRDDPTWQSPRDQERSR